jgi:uncharacterized protein YndB with AHSA1/START domain
METEGHEQLLPSAEAGCLLLADISGYTGYLNATELEHAQDVLADVTERVVGSLRPTFRIAELEGDAIFAYALERELEAAMLLDTIDQTYFGFRSRVRDVAQVTACTCRACRLIPSLDLKFVAHHGRFVRSQVAGTKKPAGADVVVAHRLVKNTVRDQLDLTGYALLTQACVDALDIDPKTLGWREHREHYDDVGEVLCHVEDLQERWRYEQERQRAFVLPADAQFEFTRTFAVPAPTLWEYQTSPAKRLLWQTEFSRIDQSNPSGRRGPGTTNHCVHGRGVVVEEILDWRPYRYFTERTTVPLVGPWVFTFEFVPLDDDRTELRMRAARLTGIRRLLGALMRRPMMAGLRKNMDRLHRLLAQEGVDAPGGA